MPENRRATRLPSASDARPRWARALDLFYADSFDLRSRQDLAEAMADFVELPPGEQAFHQAHLAFRQVQALGDVHASLRRIEGLLGGLDLGALKHLAPMREALEEIADAQTEVLEALEDQGAGDEEEEDEEEGEDELFDDEPPVVPEVVVPEIVDQPPAEAPETKKPSRPRVIDVPVSEAA